MLATMHPMTYHQPSPSFAPYSPLSDPNSHKTNSAYSRVSYGLDTASEAPNNMVQLLNQEHRNSPFGRTAFESGQPYSFQQSVPTSPFQRAPSMTPVRAHRSSSASGPVRRRISRACDQCNQLRTKCDGKAPCTHCIEFGLTCEYNRERKKRGKASRKEIAAQQAAAAAAASMGSAPAAKSLDGPSGRSAEAGTEQAAFDGSPLESDQRAASMTRNEPEIPKEASSSPAASQNRHRTSDYLDAHLDAPVLSSQQSLSSHSSQHRLTADQGRTLIQPILRSNDSDSPLRSTVVQDYGRLESHQPNTVHQDTSNLYHTMMHDMYAPLQHAGEIGDLGDHSFPMLSPHTQRLPTPATYGLTGPDSPYGFGPSPLSGSPGWLSMPTPSAALYQQTAGPKTSQHLRYPVLQPLLPYLGSIVPISVACDLLDLYFQSTSNVFQQPQSPYVLGYVFRKRSFLRGRTPRVCSPALLASMLWVAAQTSESPFFTSPPSARGKICQKLLELTVGLLKPLIHTPAPGPQFQSPATAPDTVVNGVALGGLGVTIPGQQQVGSGVSPGAAAALDDVVTYIHLATVVSATEYKAASLRWWNAAWSLCRELKLGRELADTPEPHNEYDDDPGITDRQDLDGLPLQGDLAEIVSEEQREERRRIWWLCYTMDRHLALCYNRPLFLLDQECEGLLQPIDDSVFQTSEFYEPRLPANTPDHSSRHFRHRGPSIECSGLSIFGYFTPLMTILGQVVALKHARNHPRFGARLRTTADWEEQEHEITAQLEIYGRSLHAFAARQGTDVAREGGDAELGSAQAVEEVQSSAQSVASGGGRLAEALFQTRIVVAYGTHLMHTLHILVHGRWDPIALLDDDDLWISSQSFIAATGHAVNAAEALNEILDNDPDLSFMPFFFGIYLLQSSFLLLLIADKLRGDASESVVKACETIVRAHEACVVTLNTEYQRNFRRVMRSALMQVRGRMNEDYGEQQMKRREVLALYRWTGDGSGLAL